MIQISIMVGGKEKKYSAAGMNLGASLRAYELFRRYDDAKGDYSPELTMECLEFIRDIFGRAFSLEELMSGYKGSAYVLIPNMLRAAVGYVADEIVNFPEPAMTEAKPKAAKV